MPTVTLSPELTLLYLLSGVIGVTLHELGHLLVPLRVSRAGGPAGGAGLDMGEIEDFDAFQCFGHEISCEVVAQLPQC